MSTPKPSAPPFFCEFTWVSKTNSVGFVEGFYLKSSTTYVEGRAEGLQILTALQPLMPPDARCVKMSIRNMASNILHDGFDSYFQIGEYAGTYTPTTGSDQAPNDWETGIGIRLQNLSTGIHVSRHLRPIPHTLVLNGVVLTPDAAYTAALSALESALEAHAVFVVKSPGGSPLVQNIDEVVPEFNVVRVPGGESAYVARGRARTNTYIPPA